MCISLESTEQRAVLMLLFERYSHKFLDKILQEVPQDSLSGTTPLMSTLTSTRCHVRDSPGIPPPFLCTASDQKPEVGTAWERG